MKETELRFPSFCAILLQETHLSLYPYTASDIPNYCYYYMYIQIILLYIYIHIMLFLFHPAVTMYDKL